MNTATLPPISQQLSTRCALALLGAMVLASVVGLLALGPVTAVADAHRLTDPRTPLGLTNGWSVLLQLPLLVAACTGALCARRFTAEAALRHAWTAFFTLATAATLGSMADHLTPSEGGYVLSKALTASACAALAMIFLAERVSMGWVNRLPLRVALASGPIGAFLWFASDVLLGQPDYRLLLWLEHLPMLLVPLGVWSLPGRHLRSGDWIAALMWFASAECIDWADRLIWAASGSVISGHALHHLPLTACLFSLAWALARQSAAHESAPSASSQRETSLITSG
ncbi:MAG: hypothetical protein H0W40_18295 [Methylibium sp.]|uniref:hypothetical protein n=1 Tax=Methylibium sp. TaxID=2067992 RepID=UPI0017E61EB7|nr:hypothetical protein [Methylibium sp.]MBA3599304.1 hypothetical protein [Methylibium sp.]